MGQSHHKNNLDQLPTRQNVDKNIQILFRELPDTLEAEKVNQPIIMISRYITQSGSFQHKPEGFYANPILLKCLYHPNFEKTIKNFISLLHKQLKSILEAKFIALISREKFRKILNITNFCIFFTNVGLIQTVNLLSVRSDLQPKTKEFLTQISKQNPEINQQILEDIDKEELAEFERILRLSMSMMIDLHLKLITRSDFTLKIIDRLNESLFVFYSKIFFARISDISKRETHQNFKILLKIGAYFLGLGLETNTPSIYELAVLLLAALINNNKQHLKHQKALPSHLFKSLPIVSHNQMMHWITNNMLFALKYVKDGANIMSKININRIHSFKLLNLIFEHYKPHDHQITFLLEQLCLQTKTYQIERVYVSALAAEYSKVEPGSDIIKKYTQLGHIAYNVKASKKEVKIQPEDVRTELEDNEDDIQRQVIQLCSKYTLQVIFQKKEVYYEYSDKALWNMILYQMQEESSGMHRQQQMQLNKEGEVEES